MSGDTPPQVMSNESLVELYNKFNSNEMMSLSEEQKKKQILGLITSILRERIKK